MNKYRKYNIEYKKFNEVCDDLAEEATNVLLGISALRADPAFCSSVVIITTKERFHDYGALKFRTGNRFIGRMSGMKEDNLSLLLMAAEYTDYKVRKCTSVKFAKRTYPIYYKDIAKCEVVKQEDLPLYINFAFISPQFKIHFTS